MRYFLVFFVSLSLIISGEVAAFQGKKLSKDEKIKKVSEAIGNPFMEIIPSMGPIGQDFVLKEVSSDGRLVDDADITKEIRKKLREKYVFMCVIFNVSLASGVEIEAQTDRGDLEKYEFKRGARPKWVRLGFHFLPKGKTGEEIKEGIQVLGLTPDVTKVRTKKPIANDVAATLSDLATDVIVPVGTVVGNDDIGKLGQASAKGLKILFDRFFPEQLEAFAFPFLKENGIFGWEFGEDVKTTDSIVGIRKFAVFLQVDRNVVSTEVECFQMMQWTENLSKTEDGEFIKVGKINSKIFDNFSSFYPSITQ